MAIYGQNTSFTDAFQQRKANQEQEFYGSLLSNALQSGGQFDIEEGNPVYTTTPMADKTESWNKFVKMKGGRITSADVQNFESAWTQAQQMKSQKQIQELSNLKLRGFDNDDIRDSVENSPELYGSLMDMVSNLEASGDEVAFGQAQALREMLPEIDTGGLIGESPFMATAGAASLALGARHLMAVDTGMMDDVKKLREQRKSIKSDLSKLRKQKANISVKADATKVDELKRKINLNKFDLQKEQNKHLLKRSDATIKRLKAEGIKLNSELKRISKIPSPANQSKLDAVNKKMTDLRDQRKGLPTASEYKKLQPSSKYEQLKGKYSKLGSFGKGGVQMGGYMGMGAMRSLGKYLGGETGESIGRTIGNLGMLGLSLRGTPWLAPILAAQPLSDLYAQYQGR